MFDFDALPPRAKRAAFAAMDRKEAAKLPPAPKVKKIPKQTPKARTPRVNPSQQVSRQYRETGTPTTQDVATLIRNYRLMHGRDPSPAQIAKLRRKRR